MKILSAEQMGEVDRLSTERFGIPSLLLMENAGRSVVDEIEQAVPRLRGRKTLVFCGRGNNGGDGFVVARHLVMRGAMPQVLLFGDPGRLKGDALTNWRIVEAQGLPRQVLDGSSATSSYLSAAPLPDLIVDALFGTGLSKPIGEELGGVVDWINRAGTSLPVFAVDMPSGLRADSPDVVGPVVRASLTVTFTALKLALVLPPAADLAGKVVVAPIGSPESLVNQPGHNLDWTDVAMARNLVPRRARTGHKGTYGHVFVAAGSRGKSGAALMTGLAALRSGAGLVTLWLPETLQSDVVGKVPELMTEFLPASVDGTPAESGAGKLLAALDACDALVVGPGLTTHPETQAFVHDLVRKSRSPIVLDADGINAFAGGHGDLRNENGVPVVITPHPGEMARLLDRPIPEIQADRLETARRLSKERRLFTVLKGFQTVIAAPSGRAYINSTGNPGMATAGTGDILSGIVGRFVAGWQVRTRGRDLDSLGDQLAAAVYVHGLAGDLAAGQQGTESLIATDLLQHLPEAFQRISRA
jgi:NAD(P)H-hydrate epimerase